MPPGESRILHYGATHKNPRWTLKNYIGKPASQLQKGIRSLEKEIADHLDKIANPKKHIPGWDALDPRQQQALLNSKWPGDIARQREQLDILQGLLRRLGGGS